MMPKLNPKQLQKAMQKMGMQQEEIDAEEVIIKTKDKELIIRNPEVSKINMMGQESIQVVGDIEERTLEKYTEEDVKTVANQAETTEDKAREALDQSNGDLAEAILNLSVN